ncbi:uncharacterized protein TNIN_28541 [Trichonephila inaurata madagascariensis]|uniref:Uncharacterized protein n=1 Tax=Trichonephila inaurata madagascariensis TaxID=2747483 RepID=A0A8X6IW25_9ARAC|nr:uncharacterized protein TNIN_28541 [Trichonephila inaurata madagascariensis]
MDRRKRKENSEIRNPEAHIMEVFSDAIRHLSTNVRPRDHFVYRYNNFCRVLRSNLNLLSLIHRDFPSLISPSQFQRFITTSFVFICFLESIRNNNLTCYFTGIFICFMLTLISFITAVFTLASAPGKSLYSNLAWISEMNFLNEVISHRIKDTQILFQITVNTDSLDVIPSTSFSLAPRTWKSFFPMSLRYYISWFNIYGIIFAVQFCVVLKCTHFREISEFLECFSYIVLIMLAVTRDRKIKKYRKEIRDKTFNLNSSIENFFKWFQHDSEVQVLLEKYEFIKTDVLNLLNPDDNSLNNIQPQSFVMFAIIAINVSHKLQYCTNLDNFKDIIRYIIFNKHWYVYQKEEMEEMNGSFSSYIKNGLMSKMKKIYELGKLFIKLRKPADMHTEHIKSELRSSKTLREISIASEEGSISEIHYSETNSNSSLESSSDSERESEFSEGERFSSTESELAENNLYNNRSKYLNENLENESIDITEVMDLSCNNSPVEILLSDEREENKKNCSRKENEENKNISEGSCLVKDKTDFSRINSTNKDLVGEGKNLDDNVKDKIISEIDHQINGIENFPYEEISETDSQVEGIEGPPPCDELPSISDHSVLSSTVVKKDYKEKDNTTSRVNKKVEVTLNKSKETRSTENIENESSEESIQTTREFAESNNSNSKNTEISTKAIDREAHGEISSKSRTKLLKCCSKTFDDLILEPRKVLKNARKCISLINLSVIENNDFKQNINHEEIISQGALINNSDKEWKSCKNAAKKLEKNLDNTHFAPFPPHSDNCNESKNAGKCPVHTNNKNGINANLNQLKSLEDVVENQSLKNETLRDNNNSTPDTSSKCNQNSVCNSIPKMSDGIVQIASESGEQLDINYCHEDTNYSLKADPSQVKVVNSETIHSAQNLSSPQQLTVTRSTKVEKRHNPDLKQKEGARLLGSGSRSNEKPEKSAHSKFVDLENNAQTEEDIYKIAHDFSESSLMLSEPIINHSEKNSENDISYDVKQPKTSKKSTNVDDIKKSIHKNSRSKLSSKTSIEKKHLENKHSEEDISRIVHDFFINYFKNTLVLSDPVVNNPENGVSDDVTLSTSLKNSLNVDLIKIMNEILFTSKHENKNLVRNFKPETHTHTNTSNTTSSTLNIQNTSGNHSLKMDSDSPDILDAKYASGSKDNTKETPKTFRKIRKPKRMLKRPVNLLYEETPENNGLKNSPLFSVSNEETSENGEETKGNSLEKTALPPMVGNDNFSKTNFQMANSLPGRKNDQESMNNVEVPFKSDLFSLELNSNNCPVEKKNDDIPLVNLIRTLSIDPNKSVEQNDNASKDKNLQNCYNDKSKIFWMNTSNTGSNDKDSYKPLSSNKEFEAETSSATSKAYENSVGQIYSKEMFNKHDVLEENKATFNTSTKATIKPHFNTSEIYHNIKTRQKFGMLKNISKDKKKKKQNPKNIQRNFSDFQDNTQKQYEGHFLIARSEKSSHSDEKISPPVNESSPFTAKNLDETVQKLNSCAFGKQALEGYVPNFTTMGKNQTVQQEKTQTSSPQINMFSKDNSDTEKSKMDNDEKVSPRQHELSPFNAKSSDKTVQKLNSYTFGQQAHERAFPNFTDMGKNQVVLQENKTQTGSKQINIFSKKNSSTEKLIMDIDGKVDPRPNEPPPSSTKSSGKTVQKFNSNIFVKQRSEVSFPNFTAMEKNQIVQQEKTQTGSPQINMFSKENCDTEKLALKKDEKASPPENERSPFANKSSDKTVQKFNSYIFGKQAPEGSLLNFTAIEKNNQIIPQGHKPLSGPAQAVLGNKTFEIRDSWFNPNIFSKETCETERLSASNFSELNKFDKIIGEENEAPKDCSGNFTGNGSFTAKSLSKRAGKELGNEPVLNSDRKGLSEGKDAFSPRENSSDELENIDLRRKNYLTDKSVRDWLPSYLKYNENNSEYLLYGDSKFLVFKRVIAKHAKDIKKISQCLQMKKSKTSSFSECETVFIRKEMSSSEKFSSLQNEAYTINNQNNQNESNICSNKNMETNYSQEQPFIEKINRNQKNQQFFKTTSPETEDSTRKDPKNQDQVPGMNREFSRQDQDSRQPIKEREKTTSTSDPLFQENMRHNTKLCLEIPDKLATNNAENQQNTQSNTSASNFQEDLNFDLQQDNEKSELKQHSTVQEIDDCIFYVSNKRVAGPSSKVVRGTEDITTPQLLSEEHSTDISRSSSEYSLVETKKITKFPKCLNKRNSKHLKHRTYSRKHEILTSKNTHWENDERLAADDQVMASDNTRSIAMINNEDLEIRDRIRDFTGEPVDNQMDDIKPICCLKCHNLNLKLYKPFSNITLHFGQNEDKENSMTEKSDQSDCKESVKSQNTDSDLCSRTEDTDDLVTGSSNQLLISENREIGRIVSTENGKIFHFENNSIELNLEVTNDMEPTHFDYSHISGREQLNLKDKDKELFVEIEKFASNK